MVSEHQLKNLPLLVIANKQDLPRALSAAQIAEKLELYKYLGGVNSYQLPIPLVNRVVQQSWFIIANFHDCITSKIIVAQKEYLDDGLSSHSAIGYKVREAKILAKMNVKISESKRYKSKLFKYRAELLAQKYAFHANIRIIKSFRNFVFAILAWPFYHYEKKLYKSIFHNK